MIFVILYKIIYYYNNYVTITLIITKYDCCVVLFPYYILHFVMLHFHNYTTITLIIINYEYLCCYVGIFTLTQYKTYNNTILYIHTTFNSTYNIPLLKMENYIFIPSIVYIIIIVIVELMIIL